MDCPLDFLDYSLYCVTKCLKNRPCCVYEQRRFSHLHSVWKYGSSFQYDWWCSRLLLKMLTHISIISEPDYSSYSHHSKASPCSSLPLPSSIRPVTKYLVFLRISIVELSAIYRCPCARWEWGDGSEVGVLQVTVTQMTELQWSAWRRSTCCPTAATQDARLLSLFFCRGDWGMSIN